jgi:cold shock CspA family protein
VSTLPGSILGGVVASFDADVGLGVIIDDDGRHWPFHCIEIADGTRHVAVGTAVRFRPTARLGRYEAAGVAAL